MYMIESYCYYYYTIKIQQYKISYKNKNCCMFARTLACITICWTSQIHDLW